MIERRWKDTIPTSAQTTTITTTTTTTTTKTIAFGLTTGPSQRELKEKELSNRLHVLEKQAACNIEKY